MSEPAEKLTAEPGIWGALRAIIAMAEPSRRRQLRLTVALMIVGAIAEMVTIGAALPFLALLADPEGASRIPAVRTVLDLLGWSGDADLLLPAALLLVSAAILAGAVRLLLAWSSNAFVFRLGHDLSVALFSRVLRQPYLYHIQRNSAEVIAGVEKVQEALFSVLLPVMQGAVAAFIAMFVIALLIAIDPFLAACSAAAIASLYLALSLVLKGKLQANSRLIGEAHILRIKQLQEGLGGIRDILIDRSHTVFEDAFRTVDDQLRRAQMTNTFLATAPRFIIEAGAIVLIALLALYMSGQPGGLVRAIPVLGGLAIGAQRLLPLLQTIYMAWSRTAGSKQSLIDIAELLSAPLPSAPPTERAMPFTRQIEFDRVDFHYPGSRRQGLNEASFTIAKGEWIGLVGKTGSGKSTLLDLAMGLLSPSSGEIRIDDDRLDESNRASWQAQIAHVPQFIYLADSTIAENIAFGEEAGGIDRDQVRSAAKVAQIDDFIQGLPDGYETRIGERGVRLSGGQRQRIGIARALYKSADILVLDEATSALDGETEKEVMSALRREAPGLTMLIVAHRLTSLSGCDRLVRLEEGRITGIEELPEARRLSPRDRLQP